MSHWEGTVCAHAGITVAGRFEVAACLARTTCV